LLARAIDKFEAQYEQNIENGWTPNNTQPTEKNPDIDELNIGELTGGLQTGHLNIVAGASVVGIAVNVALHFVRPVLVFSMKMPGDSLAMRMISSLGRIDQHKVITGKLEDDDWSCMTSAINLLAGAPLFIDDSPSLTAIEVSNRARRMACEYGQLGLIVVDYDDKKDKQFFELSESLKALAKDLDVPVVVFSQLNRSLEK